MHNDGTDYLEFARAFDAGQFYPVFQPIVGMPSSGSDADGHSGFEMLLRWRHPSGPISPQLFFRDAERIGFDHELWRFALMSAFEFARNLGPDQFVSVNMTPRDFLRDDCEATIYEFAERTKVPLHVVHLELVEEPMPEGVPLSTLAQRLDRLHANGAYISMDDFGTGHSNTHRLLNLPFDQIKIDKSIIDHIEFDPNAANVLKAVVSLAQALGVHTVVEGIERDSQVECVARAGVEAMQGHLIGRPMAAREALAWLDAFDPAAPTAPAPEPVARKAPRPLSV